jgi:hypothetical protein
MESSQESGTLKAALNILRNTPVSDTIYGRAKEIAASCNALRKSSSGVEVSFIS